MRKKEIAIIIIGLIGLVLSVFCFGDPLQRTQLFPSTARLQPSDEIKDPHIKEQFIRTKQWAEKLQQMLDTTFRKIALGLVWDRGTGDNIYRLDGYVGIGTETPDTKFQVVGISGFGDDAGNELFISGSGVVTMAGTAKRTLNLRPDLDFAKITAQGKPTQVVYGAFLGYSLPTYATDEELFLSMNTPGRWDEASDIIIHVLVALSGTEDVNDDFRLQVSWEHADIGEPIENTTHDVEVETNLLTGRVAAYDTYQVSFTLDYDVDTPDILAAHDLIAMRLRRITAAGTEINGEVIILDYHMEFIVDKMFRAL